MSEYAAAFRRSHDVCDTRISIAWILTSLTCAPRATAGCVHGDQGGGRANADAGSFADDDFS